MNKNKLAQLVEETLNSMDGAHKAEPAPYLLTRINVRLHSEQVSVWERISIFLSRPVIAFATVSFLVIINLIIYSYGNAANTNAVQNMQAAADVYSMNSSSALFDLENIQP